MKKEVFDLLPSNEKTTCPVCGGLNTEPYPDCNCRSETRNMKWGNDIMPNGFHIKKYHHECKKVTNVTLEDTP